MQMLKYLEYKLDRIWIEKQNRDIYLMPRNCIFCTVKY